MESVRNGGELLLAQWATHMVSDINCTEEHRDDDTEELPLSIQTTNIFSSACHLTLVIPGTPMSGLLESGYLTVLLVSITCSWVGFNSWRPHRGVTSTMSCPRQPCSAPVASRGFFYGVSPPHIWSSSFPAAPCFSQQFCLFQRTPTSYAVPVVRQLQCCHSCFFLVFHHIQRAVFQNYISN